MDKASCFIFLLSLLCLSLSHASTPFSSPPTRKIYPVSLSIDSQSALDSTYNTPRNENLFISLMNSYHAYSTDTGTAMALSVVNLLNFIGDNYYLSNRLSYDTKTGRLTFKWFDYNLLITGLWGLSMWKLGDLMATANHEWSGHTVRALEFGRTVGQVQIDFNGSGFTTYSLLPLTKAAYFPLQEVLISLAGFQANTVLSEKIVWQLLKTKQPWNNLAAWLYMRSSQNQCRYISSTWNDDYIIKYYDHDGDDIASYVREMQRWYGIGSVTVEKLQSLNQWFQYLDPIWYIALCAIPYSLAYHQGFDMPMIPIGQIPGLGCSRILPMAKLVLTPYSVLEKRLIVFFDTEYTAIKFSFGFGKESKTNKPAEFRSKRQELAYFDELFKKFQMDSNDAGLLTVPDARPPEEHNTYYLELVIGRLFSIDKFDIGLSLALWQQPDLCAKCPRYAAIKIGGMAVAHLTYHAHTHLNLCVDLGCKSQGFVLGQTVKPTPWLRVGITWML